MINRKIQDNNRNLFDSFYILCEELKSKKQGQKNTSPFLYGCFSRGVVFLGHPVFFTFSDKNLFFTPLIFQQSRLKLVDSFRCRPALRQKMYFCLRSFRQLPGFRQRFSLSLRCPEFLSTFSSSLLVFPFLERKQDECLSLDRLSLGVVLFSMWMLFL